jgi:RecB family endonuclease NucS
MSGDIGTLQRLLVRDVFSHEAYDFTTWMERNPDALSNAVGIELADVKREHNAGDFSVDLFAEDEDGHRVIIENQLETTDHKHLGQVLIYLSVCAGCRCCPRVRLWRLT